MDQIATFDVAHIPQPWREQRRAKLTAATHLPFERNEIDRSLIDRWQRIVAHFPEQIAIQAQDLTVTYAELAALAARIALRIGQHGSRAPLIALLFDHGAEPIVAIMGVMQAGYGYVALSSDFPPVTLAEQLTDSEADIVIAADGLLPLARQICLSNQTVIPFEAAIAPVADSSLETHAPATDRDSILTVTYTSGSTGKSKGIIRRHASVLHSAWRDANLLCFSAHDRMALIYSWTYGFASRLLFEALLTGTTLLPVNAQQTPDLVAWIVDNEITLLPLPVPLLRNLLADDSIPAALRRQLGQKVEWMLVAGQLLNWEEIGRFIEHFHCYETLFLHTLGSSEGGRLTSHYFKYPLDGCSGRIPLGFPTADKEILIVDEKRQPVQRGELGEIVIRSRYICDGYWRRPQLNAAKFERVGGDICFFSGDIGRINRLGMLEFIGRADHMVKVRGYRIELPTIESALRQIDGVTEAAVTAPAAADGERTLVAYLTTTRTPPPPAGELRSQLAHKLAPHELPHQFVILDAFPMTTTGKIDRQALPLPALTRPVASELVAAASELERQLVAIWEELFAVAPIGVTDDIFELGGDSLKVARLLTQLKRRFETEIDLELFFQQPTIRALTAQLEAGAAAPSAAAPAMPPVDDGPAVPLFPNLQRTDPFICKVGHILFETLPQGVDKRLLERATANRLIQSRLLNYRPRLVRQWLQEIDTTVDRDAALARALFYGYLQFFRLPGWGRRREPLDDSLRAHVTIQGSERLLQLRQRGQGVILVGYHTVLKHWQQLLPQPDYIIKRLYLEDIDPVGAHRGYARQLNFARQVIDRGGVVKIAADGHGGLNAHFSFDFHGRRRSFQIGLAEFALLTDAPLIPLYESSSAAHHITFRFGEPLTAGSPTMSHTQRVAHIMEQYANILRTAWQDQPWLIPLHEMEFHLSSKRL